jgi:hypothetical protein
MNMEMTTSNRNSWLSQMDRIARPVLLALSKRELKARMPVGNPLPDRRHVTHLEALGRTLAGLAPWLELSEPQDPREARLQQEYRELARAAMDAGTDPASPDYLNFGNAYGDQPVVDAAFLAHAILRAPTELWEKQDSRVKRQMVACLKESRACVTWFSNWLLFGAMVETALCHMGEDWDRMRVDYALRQHEQWYLGDGMYGDGPRFHWDYYNSFVIQPMLVDIIDTMAAYHPDWPRMRQPILNRAARYAGVLERLISPEGTFPVIGRSMAYRFGVFQHLAQMALQHRLPQELEPAQVRCALAAVIRRMLEMPNTFDEEGWLRVGCCGHQPEMGEVYISTGSLYLCTTAFLPLGLDARDPFWQNPDCDWTSRQIWSGRPVRADHAMQE